MTPIHTPQKALDAAAQIALNNDAKAFRARYEVTYAKKRFDQYDLERDVNNALDIHAEDIAAAICALSAQIAPMPDNTALINAQAREIARLRNALFWYSKDTSSQGDIARAALKGTKHE